MNKNNEMNKIFHNFVIWKMKFHNLKRIDSKSLSSSTDKLRFCIYSSKSPLEPRLIDNFQQKNESIFIICKFLILQIWFTNFIIESTIINDPQNNW